MFLEDTMENEKNDKEQEKGFVVKDKRFSAKKEEEPQAQEEGKKGEAQAPEEITSGQNEPLPEIDFVNLIFSLSTSVLIQLGEIQDPMTQQSGKNLPLAKQTIDIIGMLREKAKGNLTQDEEKVIENILYDLRIRYVKVAG